MADKGMPAAGGNSLDPWRVGALWVVTTTLGWMAALGISMLGPEMGILIGAVMGAAQWMILRRYIAGAAWWIPASAFGWLLGGLVAGVLLGTEGGLVSVLIDGAFIGAAMGALQWLILRRQVRSAALWIPASATGWVIAWAAASAMDVLVTGGTALQGYVPTVVIGLVTGAFTAVALVYLLQRPVISEAAPTPKPEPRPTLVNSDTRGVPRRTRKR